MLWPWLRPVFGSEVACPTDICHLLSHSLCGHSLGVPVAEELGLSLGLFRHQRIDRRLEPGARRHGALKMSLPGSCRILTRTRWPPNAWRPWRVQRGRVDHPARTSGKAKHQSRPWEHTLPNLNTGMECEHQRAVTSLLSAGVAVREVEEAEDPEALCKG